MRTERTSPDRPTIAFEQWQDDCETLLTAVMYGCPPGGWSDPERREAFVAKIYDIETRVRGNRTRLDLWHGTHNTGNQALGQAT